MPIEKAAKELIFERIKMAREKLATKSLDGVGELSLRIGVLAEVFPDDVWSKELKFTALVLNATAGTTDAHFKDLPEDQKDIMIKAFTDALDNLYKNIDEGDIEGLHTTLKNLGSEFWKVLGP